MPTIIEGADYFIRLISLPGSVGGFLTPNDDGTFSMYLNKEHSGELLVEDYLHEFEHIVYDDLYDGKTIDEVEHRRGA